MSSGVLRNLRSGHGSNSGLAGMPDAKNRLLLYEAIELRAEYDARVKTLEVRKGLNEQLGELHTQVVNAAYQRVIYKEDRDIVEPNELSYAECVTNLEQTRLAFRELNRKIRVAAFALLVDFLDEHE